MVYEILQFFQSTIIVSHNLRLYPYIKKIKTKGYSDLLKIKKKKKKGQGERILRCLNLSLNASSAAVLFLKI